jgi:hypothetical protein
VKRWLTLWYVLTYWWNRTLCVVGYHWYADEIWWWEQHECVVCNDELMQTLHDKYNR